MNIWTVPSPGTTRTAVMTIAAILCVPLGTLVPAPAPASEGGASLYMDGAYNDFAAAIAGPPGLGLRNDIFRYDAKVLTRSPKGQVIPGVDQTSWVNNLKIGYISDIKLLGGTYGAAVAIPYVLDIEVGGPVTRADGSTFASGHNAGLGDLYLLPVEIYWTWGNQHLALVPGIIAPTGTFHANVIFNNGHNYWAFDPSIAYTWLDARRGHEFSFTAGLLINTENRATQYRTGNEFHLDWTAAQYLSEHLALGVTGYWYEQVSEDDGLFPSGLDAHDFHASGAGIGPIFLYETKIGGRTWDFIGKWISDVHSRNRFNGDVVMFSIGVQL